MHASSQNWPVQTNKQTTYVPIFIPVYYPPPPAAPFQRYIDIQAPAERALTMPGSIDPDAVGRAMMADLGIHRQKELPLSNKTRVPSYTPASDNYALSFDDRFKYNLGAAWQPIENYEAEHAAGLIPENPRPWATFSRGSAAIPIMPPKTSTKRKVPTAPVQAKDLVVKTPTSANSKQVSPASTSPKKMDTNNVVSAFKALSLENVELHTVWDNDCAVVPKSQGGIQIAARVKLAVDSKTNKAYIIFTCPNREDSIGDVLDVEKPVMHSNKTMCFLTNRKDLADNPRVQQINADVCFSTMEQAEYFKVAVETLQKSALAHQSKAEAPTVSFNDTARPVASAVGPLLIDLEDHVPEKRSKEEALADTIYESVNNIRLQLRDMDTGLTDYSPGSLGDACFSVWARKDLSQVEESHHLRPHLKTILSFLFQLGLESPPPKVAKHQDGPRIASLEELSSETPSPAFWRYSASELMSMQSKAASLHLGEISPPVTIKSEEEPASVVLTRCPPYNGSNTLVNASCQVSSKTHIKVSSSFQEPSDKPGRTAEFRGLATSKWAN